MRTGEQVRDARRALGTRRGRGEHSPNHDETAQDGTGEAEHEREGGEAERGGHASTPAALER